MSALWSRANWQPQSRGSRALLGYWKHCSKTQQPPPPHCITISDNVVITFKILYERYVYIPGGASFFDYSLVRGTTIFAMGQQGWERHKEINSIRVSFGESIDKSIARLSQLKVLITFPVYTSITNSVVIKIRKIWTF